MNRLLTTLALLIFSANFSLKAITIQEQLDQWFSHFYENQKLMGSLHILKGGKTIYSATRGFADLDSNIALTDSTLFRIGSISKTFTAALYYKLVEEGTINPELTLASYFPDFPNAALITTNHLLRHQSGIFNFTNDISYQSYLSEEKSNAELMDIITSYDPDFKPGEQSEYSNPNYLLLTWILEMASGKSYAELLSLYILQPLQLRHTFYQSSAGAFRESKSYSRELSKWKDGTITHMSIPQGAGAIISTPSDLSLFFRALVKGSVISQASLEQMTTIERGYGAGIFKFPFNETFAFGHGGGIDGFVAQAAHLPTEDITIGFCVNGLDYPMNDLMIGMLSILLEKNYTLPNLKTVNVSPETLSKYVGTYSAEGFPMDIVISAEGETLYAQASGQGKFPLTATADNKFKFDAAGLQMVFEIIDDKMVMSLLQMGQKILFTRR